MFRFGEPVYLYLLIILPILVGLYLYSNYRRRKKIAQYGDPELLAHLMPDVSTQQHQQTQLYILKTSS